MVRSFSTHSDDVKRQKQSKEPDGGSNPKFCPASQRCGSLGKMLSTLQASLGQTVPNAEMFRGYSRQLQRAARGG